MGENPDRLSVDDARILALESEAIAGHTLKLLVLEPGERLDLEALRASVDARLAGEPRALQRVERDADGSARWVTDEDFDISAHVRRHEAADCDDQRALWRVAGELMSKRLDHDRPLWSFDVVGPLSDGREAIVARIHHAMADGISSVRFLGAVLWEAAAEATTTAAGKAPAAKAAAAVKHSRLAELRRLPGALHRELGGHAADSRLDRPIGSARELAFVTVGSTS